MDQDVRSSFSCTNSGAVTVSSCVLPPRVADGSDNALTDATTYADTGEDAATGALYSTADLTIGGTGSLTVTGNSNKGSSAAASGHSDAGEPAVMAVNAVLRI